MNARAVIENFADDWVRVLFERAELLGVEQPTFELRMVKTRRGTISGYFNEAQKLAAVVAALDKAKRADAIYCTLNPVAPALFPRAANRFEEYAKLTTDDGNILRRIFLPFDLDADRPAGISSTDAEHDAALARGREVRDFLIGELGFPEPFLGDSGNGGHVLSGIDLPNDADSLALVNKCIQAVAGKFGDEKRGVRDGGIRVVVDATVGNAARIWKLYGTHTRKGDLSPDNPHRMARILSLPIRTETVPREVLEKLAALAPSSSASGRKKSRKPATSTSKNGEAAKPATSTLNNDESAKPTTNSAEPSKSNGAESAPTKGVHEPDLDVPAWCEKHGLTITKSKPFGDGGTLWALECCPLDSAHNNAAACIIKFANGVVTAKCHHNGCAGEGWREWRAAVGDPIADERPEIVIDTEEHVVADKAIEALTACGDIYQRAGQLVHVIRDDSPLRGLFRGGPTPRIAALPLPRLRELMTEHATWWTWKITKAGEEQIPAHPPDWCYKAVAARGKWTGIRRLEAIVEAPVLLPNGEVLDRPGYDATSGLLYVPSIDFGPIPKSPTLDDAKAALEELKEAIADFPFSSPEHRSACLAGMLTPLARFAFGGPSPLFLIDANVRGAGKSLLADVTSELVTGRPMARMAHPDSDEEFRKRITALALAGDPLVLIDNIVGALGCASLDGALTATTWKDRILGQSVTTPDLPLLATWYATANNAVLAADTARRILHVRLDSPEEKPEERGGFRHPDLLAWVRGQRARLVRAALTVLRAYVVAGKPQKGLKAWGSFEGWSSIVREALVWCGELDPALTRSELTEQADVELTALRLLIDAWSEADWDSSGLTAGQLLVAIGTPGKRYERLRAAVLSLVPTPGDKLPSAQRLGMKLHHLRGRIVEKKYLHRQGDRAGTIWSVKSAEVKS